MATTVYTIRLLTPQADTISLELPIVEREHIAGVEMARLKKLSKSSERESPI